MILLDTNVISELMKAQPDASVLLWLDEQIETDVYLCAITKAEIELGIGLLDDGRQKQRLQHAATAVFNLFQGRCQEYDCDAASQYVKIALSSRQSGRPMSVEDMMIAAVAQSVNGLLVTRNSKDFNFLPDVRQLNPWNHSKH